MEDGDALGVGVGMMVIVGDGARLGIGVGLGSEAGLHAANVIIRKIITAAVPDLIQPHLFSNFMTYPLSYAPYFPTPRKYKNLGETGQLAQISEHTRNCGLLEFCRVFGYNFFDPASDESRPRAGCLAGLTG